MRFFARLRRILFANIHSTIGRLEEPARMLNYKILEVRDNIDQAREAVAAAMTAERRLSMQAIDAERAADQWDQRARRAIEHHEDELAREALRRKRTALELNEYYQRAHAQQMKTVTRLRTALKRLELRLTEVKARRAHLMAKFEAAHSQRVVARSIQQAVGTDAFETFDRVVFQADTELQQALALTELVDDPDESFVVAGRDGAVESELTALKRELGFCGYKSTARAFEEQADRR